MTGLLSTMQKMAKISHNLTKISN